jgi:hypothetical protein
MIFSPPLSFLDIDLFIPFNLIFVKNFLIDAKPILSQEKSLFHGSILFYVSEVIHAIKMGQNPFSKREVLPLRK